MFQDSPGSTSDEDEIKDGSPESSKSEWWEMLDWNEMKRVWKTLPEETKKIIRTAGLGPKEDKLD